MQKILMHLNVIPERFHAMKSCPSTYYIIVVEDTKLEKIVGTGTLILEQKFIHEIAVVGSLNACQNKFKIC